MSDILSPAQRARLAEMERVRLALIAPPTPDRVETLAKRGGAVGCLLMVALLVLGLAGLVALVWRRAIWG